MLGPGWVIIDDDDNDIDNYSTMMITSQLNAYITGPGDLPLPGRENPGRPRFEGPPAGVRQPRSGPAGGSIMSDTGTTVILFIVHYMVSQKSGHIRDVCN